MHTTCPLHSYFVLAPCCLPAPPYHLPPCLSQNIIFSLSLFSHHQTPSLRGSVLLPPNCLLMPRRNTSGRCTHSAPYTLYNNIYVRAAHFRLYERTGRGKSSLPLCQYLLYKEQRASSRDKFCVEKTRRTTVRRTDVWPLLQTPAVAWRRMPRKRRMT